MSTTATGLSTAEARRRLAATGPNAVRSQWARALPVLRHQVRSPLLGLLLAAAVASAFVGKRSDALISGVTVALSVKYLVGVGMVDDLRRQFATRLDRDADYNK